MIVHLATYSHVAAVNAQLHTYTYLLAYVTYSSGEGVHTTNGEDRNGQARRRKAAQGIWVAEKGRTPHGGRCPKPLHSPKPEVA